MTRTRAATLVLLLFLAPAGLNAAWNPEGWEIPPHREEVGPTNPVSVMLNGLLGVYRTHLSPLGEGKCPSFPSCSTYSLQAIKRHGPLAGSLLTASRLITEGDEAAFSRWVYIGGEQKVWYPVEEELFLREIGRER